MRRLRFLDRFVASWNRRTDRNPYFIAIPDGKPGSTFPGIALRSAGLAAIGILMGSQAALSGGALSGEWGGEGWVRYKPDYEGYHLRPPYYLPDLGWYTPPDFHDRSLYFGYHFHEPGRPLVARPKYRVVRLTSAHVEWCRAAYASYRPEDNSFVAYSGRRKQCRPPYR